MDWISEFLDGKKASSTQISIIEGLLITSAIPQKEKEQIDLELDGMLEERAIELIEKLRVHNVETEPRKQNNKWEKRRKK